MLEAIGPLQVEWGRYLPDLLGALRRTMAFTAAGFVGATILGLVVALLRLSPLGILRIPAKTYTELFKNVPLLALIFVTYFGLPSVDVELGAFAAGVLSLVVFYAAYLSETFRSAIAGVHSGQKEASEALGMGRLTTFAVVVFPQALRLALPGTNTFLVDMLKSTSLLVVISAGELMSQGRIITSTTFRALEVYLVVAALYFAMCYPLSQVLLWLERRVSAGVPLAPRRRRLLNQARARLAEEGVVV